MTVYYEIMQKRLEANRKAVDELHKAEYLIGILGVLQEAVKKGGGDASFDMYSACLDIRGKEEHFTMKDVKILLDVYLFVNDRFEISENHTESFIFMSVRDKNTGGEFKVDIAMGNLKCRRVEVSRETVTREEIKYRYECE